jgi:hypothetical protein
MKQGRKTWRGGKIDKQVGEKSWSKDDGGMT